MKKILQKIKVDPLNIKMDDFKEMSDFAGISSGFQKAEEKIIDSVNNFNEKIFSLIDDQFGIASLTTRFNDALMWSHYASSHTGICIEYDFSDYMNHINQSQMLLFPVNYSDKRVTIDQTILDKIDLKKYRRRRQERFAEIVF